MALSHDAYTFEDCKHGVLQTGPVPTPLLVGRFAGIVGVSIIADERKEQPLACRAILDDYASLQALKTAIKTIHSKAGKLTGTLTISGPAAETVEKCTFAGFEQERIFKDGSGVHGWVCFGRLLWIRRSQE